MKKFISLFKFSTSYRSNFGQAGLLDLQLIKSNYDVKIETTWEDHSDIIVDGESQQWMYEEEEKTQKLVHLQSIPDVCNVRALIPEYYNLKGVVHGNVQQVPGQVDAKLMGDIDMQITSESGGFMLNKVKSQLASLNLINGPISVQKYLEGQTCKIKTLDGKIKIKKLATSKLAQINTHNGDIDIGAFYALSEIKLKIMHDNNRLALQKYIESISHLQLNSLGSKNIIFKNFGGGLIAQLDKVKQFSITQMSDTLISVTQNEGDCLLGIGDNCSGIVDVKNGKLKLQLNKLSEINIYDTRSGCFLLQNDGKPTIYVSASEVEYFEKSFFSFPQR